MSCTTCKSKAVKITRAEIQRREDKAEEMARKANSYYTTSKGRRIPVITQEMQKKLEFWLAPYCPVCKMDDGTWIVEDEKEDG